MQPWEIAIHWHWILPLLEKIPDSVAQPQDAKYALENRLAQCWGFIDSDKDVPHGVVITRLGRIGETPSGLIWMASGEPLEAFVELLRSHIEPWMRDAGCKVIEINGRRGWKRVLADYSERTTTFAKELL